MKNIKYPALAVLAALTLAGCGKGDGNNDKGDPTPSEVSVTITSAGQDLTRTVMEGDKENKDFRIAWVVGDAMGVYTTGGDTPNSNKQFAVMAVNTEGVATFNGTFSAGTSGEISVGGYYPRIATSDAAGSVTLSLSGEQTMNGASYDRTADLMVAQPRTVTVSSETLDIADFSFRHLVGFVNFSVEGFGTGGEAPADEDGIAPAAADVVQSVKFTAGETASPVLWGNVTADLTDGTSGEFSAGDNEIVVTVPSGTTLGDLDAWFVSAPFSLAAAEKLTFTVTTDKHVISKTHTLTEAFALAESGVKTFGITVDNDCTVNSLNPSDTSEYELYVPAAINKDNDNYIVFGDEVGELDLTTMTVEFWFRAENLVNMQWQGTVMGNLRHVDGNNFKGWEINMCGDVSGQPYGPYVLGLSAGFDGYFSEPRKGDVKYPDDGTPFATSEGEVDYSKEYSWHHIAYVFVEKGNAGGTVNQKYYIDGNYVHGHSVGESYNLSDRMVYAFRATDNTKKTNGSIKNVRFWNKALSDAEIVYYKDNAVDGTEEGLEAAWDFNRIAPKDGDGKYLPLADKTGRHNATIVGNEVVWTKVE